MANKGTFFVHVTFWITAATCSLIVLSLCGKPDPESKVSWAPSDSSWRLGTHYWMGLVHALVLVLILGYLTAWLSEGPLPGSNLRFDNTPSSVVK